MNGRAPFFQEFQREFAEHVRDPHRHRRPVGVPARRMAVYNELLFNNLTRFLDACFPISRDLLGERRWRRLNRQFFRDWHSHTPYFREIPREFLHWLLEAETAVPLPRWLRELAHYEWAELAVDVMEADPPACDASGDLMDGEPVLAPALMNLAYSWPVQRIGPAWKPRSPVPTHLIVFRDLHENVRFAELNAVSARLVALVADGGRTGRQCSDLIAGELGHPDPAVVAAGAREILEGLRQQQAILGVRP